MKYSAIALIGTTSAQQRILMELPSFTGESYGNYNVVQNMLDTSTTFFKADGAGEVTYAQCDDDTGAFTLDTDNTTNSPNPVTKGSKLSFELEGILGDSIHVDHLTIHVDWNGSSLYDEDHQVAADFDSVFQYGLDWDVPGYAPNGKYDVTIKGWEASSGDNKTNLCLSASFSF